VLRNTPPLDAICVFEVVGRLSSLTRAAHELFVTPSAVSHHINTLEQYLGVPLLRRVGNRVELTSEGRRYHNNVAAGIGQILQGTQQFRAASSTHFVRIAVCPPFASSWLIPRLRSFIQAHPTLSLLINASAHPPDLVRGEADIAIRYMEPADGDLVCAALGDNAVFPVCSPQLTRGRRALRSVHDLSEHTILRDLGELDHPTTRVWDRWLRAAGVAELRGCREIFFSSPELTQQAAIDGLGVALTRTLLAASSISQKTLVCPFGPALAVTSQFCVLCTGAQLRRREVGLFRQWLIKEAAMSTRRARPRAVHEGTGGRSAAPSVGPPTITQTLRRF
jgi:LysR family transcriptional regulator, glycine cleavage system transcriptional activator